MDINLEKIVPSFSYNEESQVLEYFNQFNIYETIDCNIDSYNSMYGNCYNSNICNIEYTCPNLNVISVNIVTTGEGTSLEGQHLTGKKLVIIGFIELSLILTYFTIYKSYDIRLKRIQMPFSTFIVIPKEVCHIDTINIKYLIEDISVVKLCEDKILVSITVLIQYIDI